MCCEPIGKMLEIGYHPEHSCVKKIKENSGSHLKQNIWFRANFTIILNVSLFIILNENRKIQYLHTHGSIHIFSKKITLDEQVSNKEANRISGRLVG